MSSAVKHTRIIERFVPRWAAMVQGTPAPLLVKRAGRNVTSQELHTLKKTVVQRGGGQDGNIQFGFLGGFGGVGVPGESTG